MTRPSEPARSGRKPAHKPARKAGPKTTRRPAGPTEPASGTFRAHPRGFGFVDLDTPAGPTAQVASAFVPPPLARGLVDGDRICCRVSLDDRGATVEKVSKVTRRRRYVCGTIARRGQQLVLELDPQLGAGAVALDAVRTARTRPGRVAVVAITSDVRRPVATELVAGPAPAGSADAARFAAVTRSFGHEAFAGTLGDVDTADRHFRGLLAAEREAAAKVRRRPCPRGVPGADLGRTDLTGLHTVTVDGASSRDLDDAVSAAVGRDGTVRVHVHIADVAAYVPLGSGLDRRAVTLTTSTYLGDHVAPMLPADLSEGALSLLPGVARDTLTAAFTVGRDGRVGDVELAVSRIVSDDRLTYDRVQDHLDGDQLSGPTGETVAAMASAADALGRARDGRDTLTRLFTPSRRDVAVDGRTVTAVDAEPYPGAMLVIERLMVAANEAVATWLAARDVPALYRTHAGVDPARADRLDAALTAHGSDPAAVAAAGYDAATLAGIIDAADGDVAAAIAQTAADAMGRAGYTTAPEHHFGLDSRPYTHFTSPIRRYADLVVHRAVRAALAGEPAPQSRDELDEVAAWIGVRAGASARAEALERTLLWGLWLRGELAAGRTEPVEATVRRITPAGLVVRVDEFGIGGFVPAEAATGRRGKLTVADGELADAAGRFRVGARTRARLDDVDDTGRLTLALVG